MVKKSLTELWPERGDCRLCGEVRDLCRSHVVPKFVSDWLKATNITGRFRTTDAPNRLVEDMVWRRMLCLDCEARFNRFETEVCETIFLPIHERRQDRFRYGPSFLKFLVSVVWRAIVLQKAEGGLGKLTENLTQVESAELTWREFLLDKRKSPAPHDVHALPLDVPVGGDFSDWPPHLARVMLRGIAQGTRYYAGDGYVHVKMARLLVIGTVSYGKERRLWKATKIHAEGGSWGVEEFGVPAWLFQALKLHAETLEKTLESLSDTQKLQTLESLTQAAKANPSAFAASDNFKAFEHDFERFGRRAFQQLDEDTTKERLKKRLKKSD